MKLKHIITAAAVAILPVAASAGTFYIPGVGNGPGANGSQWRTEVRVHLTGTQQANLFFRYHQGEAVHDGRDLRLRPSTTQTLPDAIEDRFPATSGPGTLELYTNSDKESRRLAITARVYNTLPNGDQLSQDVPVLTADDAAITDDLVILNGPSDALRSRFNFGLYALEATRVTWDLLRADGTAIASKSITYKAKQQVQYNSGTQLLFNANPADGDTVRAVMESGKAFIYGSAVDLSGDPTYIPGIRTREQYDLIFDGIDIDEDGDVDIPDANNDGILDAPLEIVTSLFPASVKVIAHTEFGNAIRGGLSIISSTSDAEFVDFQGTLMIGAAGDLKGKTGEIRIRARADSSVETFVIPVKFL